MSTPIEHSWDNPDMNLFSVDKGIKDAPPEPAVEEPVKKAKKASIPEAIEELEVQG
jgi:hypothetical protein